MSTILDLWKEERGGVARAIRRLESAESQNLGGLLSILRANLQERTKFAKEEAESAAEPVITLGEHEVDEVLSDHVAASRFLGELEALDRAAAKWRTVLTTLCEAIDNHANTDDEKADLMRVLEHHPRSAEWEKQKKRSRRLREPLCEADDEYWYL